MIHFRNKYPSSTKIHYSKAVFLNRRDASRYRDLETFLPGLRTLEKFKIYQKLHKNEVS